MAARGAGDRRGGRHELDPRPGGCAAEWVLDRCPWSGRGRPSYAHGYYSGTTPYRAWDRPAGTGRPSRLAARRRIPRDDPRRNRPRGRGATRLRRGPCGRAAGPRRPVGAAEPPPRAIAGTTGAVLDPDEIMTVAAAARCATARPSSRDRACRPGCDLPAGCTPRTWCELRVGHLDSRRRLPLSSATASWPTRRSPWSACAGDLQLLAARRRRAVLSGPRSTATATSHHGHRQLDEPAVRCPGPRGTGARSSSGR